MRNIEGGGGGGDYSLSVMERGGNVDHETICGGKASDIFDLKKGPCTRSRKLQEYLEIGGNKEGAGKKTEEEEGKLTQPTGGREREQKGKRNLKKG